MENELEPKRVDLLEDSHRVLLQGPRTESHAALRDRPAEQTLIVGRQHLGRQTDTPDMIPSGVLRESWSFQAISTFSAFGPKPNNQKNKILLACFVFADLCKNKSMTESVW